jgi:hypothetical protein
VSASRATTLPLYVGGFLGPFGAGVLAVLIPQLRDAFDATTAEIALACALLVGALGFAGGPAALAALWFAAGAASALVWAGMNTLVVEAVPENVGRPLYHADARLGFLGAGVMALLSGVLVLPLRSVA